VTPFVSPRTPATSYAPDSSGSHRRDHTAPRFSPANPEPKTRLALSRHDFLSASPAIFRPDSPLCSRPVSCVLSPLPCSASPAVHARRLAGGQRPARRCLWLERPGRPEGPRCARLLGQGLRPAWGREGGAGGQPSAGLRPAGGWLRTGSDRFPRPGNGGNGGGPGCPEEGGPERCEPCDPSGCCAAPQQPCARALAAPRSAPERRPRPGRFKRLPVRPAPFLISAPPSRLWRAPWPRPSPSGRPITAGFERFERWERTIARERGEEPRA